MSPTFAYRRSCFGRPVHGLGSQRGLSFIGLLLVAIIGAMVFLLGSQATPIFLEHQAVQRAVQKAANESGTPNEARSAFDRFSQVDGIETITAADLEVRNNGGEITIRYAYERGIALFGPAHLVFRFEGQNK